LPALLCAALLPGQARCAAAWVKLYCVSAPSAPPSSRFRRIVRGPAGGVHAILLASPCSTRIHAPPPTRHAGVRPGLWAGSGQSPDEEQRLDARAPKVATRKFPRSLISLEFFFTKTRFREKHVFGLRFIMPIGKSVGDALSKQCQDTAYLDFLQRIPACPLLPRYIKKGGLPTFKGRCPLPPIIQIVAGTERGGGKWGGVTHYSVGSPLSPICAHVHASP